MSEQPMARVIDEAAQWMALLHSGHLSEEDAAAFQRWHDGDALHAQVFRRMSQGLGEAKRPGLQRLPEEQVIAALQLPSGRRQLLRNSLGALGGLGVAALAAKTVGERIWAPGDLLTLTAERRSFVLDGGSRLTLDAQTRVSPRPPRTLYVHQGAVQLECSGPSLTLETELADIEVEQGGTLLLAQRFDGEIRLTVLARQSVVRSRQGDALRVRAGQQARLIAGQAPWLGRADPAASAWLSGLYEARESTLGEVVEALRAYRHGVLRVTPEAAKLKISGLFPLDDSARALRLIAAALPIRLASVGALWVSIDLA
ncbi:DUF4880 domain-containing protein [Pseudomonas putida]|uniref:DUF4880 domain-containing protein n=1 Tax=Pseudomonas putida TaxID=303 RepID=UPI00383B3944